MAESKASTNEVDSTSDISDAVNHFIQGKRHLLVQDYISAVSSLQEACQRFAQKYGEASNECGEPYLYYGKALLELARMETGVLGNALEGVPAEEDESDSGDDQVESPDNISEEEREKIKQDVDAAIDENSRDLEEKFQQLKEKSDNETSTPTASEDKSVSNELGGTLQEDIFQQAKEKSEDEPVASTANKNQKLSVSDKSDYTVKAEETSSKGKLNSEEEADNASMKDELEKDVTNPKIVDIKEDTEKEIEAISVADNKDKVTDEEKVEIVKNGKEEVEVTDEKNMEATDEENKCKVKYADEITGGLIDTCNSEQKIEHEKVESTADENVISTKDIEMMLEVNDAKDKDFADKDGETEREIVNSTENVELGMDVEVKAEVIMDTELEKDHTKKCDFSEKVEESLKDLNQEASIIGDKNEDEKMETEVEKSINEKQTLNGGSVDVTEQQESKIKATPGTSDGIIEPSSAQDESTEDDDAEEDNDTSNVDEAKDESEAGPSGSNEEKEEDVTNLQLAWEVLEIAKIIFKRQSEKDKKVELRTAEVLLKLGEISIESENYKQAIEDLGECLRLQKLHLGPDDRAIAETFYQLGLANSFYGQFEEAIESFQKSMQVIEERIATLQQGTTVSLDKNVDLGLEDPLETAKREIEDLQSVLPDIKSKIEDTEDLMKNSEIALKEVALQRLQEDSSTASLEMTPKEQDSSKPTTNITHLLKRKRKSEGNMDTNADIDAKKHRSASGDQCANGTSVMNGIDSSLMEESDGFKKVESTA